MAEADDQSSAPCTASSVTPRRD